MQCYISDYSSQTQHVTVIYSLIYSDISPNCFVKHVKGEANSAQYARIDMLALELETNLPHFEVIRIAKTPEEWEVSFQLV